MAVLEGEIVLLVEDDEDTVNVNVNDANDNSKKKKKRSVAKKYHLEQVTKPAAFKELIENIAVIDNNNFNDNENGAKINFKTFNSWKKKFCLFSL